MGCTGGLFPGCQQAWATVAEMNGIWDGALLTGMPCPSKSSTKQFSPIFLGLDQADKEIACVNYVRALLLLKRYLSRPFGKIVKHRPQNSTSQMFSMDIMPCKQFARTCLVNAAVTGSSCGAQYPRHDNPTRSSPRRRFDLLHSCKQFS